MNKQEEIKKKLKFILKHGDIFDNVCLKEGVLPRKHPFIKFNILLLSRILYGGVLIWEKISKYFIDLQKVKQAQDDIRDFLGVNVDIITYKYMIAKKEDYEASKKLSILYLEDSVEPQIYIENLQKILDFAELNKIDNIYLRYDDIENYFIGVDLSGFKFISLAKLFGYYLNDSTNADLLFLSINDLIDLIKKLRSSNANKDYIKKIASQIEDFAIEKALEDFLNNDDLETFKSIVASRLEFLLNSDGSYKDRKYGKVYQSINLSEEYLKIVVKNQIGLVIDNKVMTLWEYLEISNLDNYNTLGEEKNIYLLASLYLHLIKNGKLNYQKGISYSFYDRIYKRFLLKKNKKIKKVKGIYSKSGKFSKNLSRYYSSFFLCAMILFFTVFGGTSLDFINGYFRNKESNILNNIIDNFILPYKYSLEFELEFLREPLSNIGNKIMDLVYMISDSTGDSYENNMDVTVGTVESLNNDIILPKYYATKYAIDSIYQSGSVLYTMDIPNNLIMEDVEPIFEITQVINRDIFKTFIKGNTIDFCKTIYPVGDEYVLVNICIKDLKSDKMWTRDYKGSVCYGNFINDSEVDFLLSFESPEITFTYGFSQNMENIFVENLQNNEVYTGANSQVKDAIIKGLGLDDNASLEEILQSIKSKNYSKTPIKDAHLSFSIKTKDEIEYFETIASLDSLICNLAASLAVESADDLIYVVGYLDDGNGNLTTKESHAWAMNTKGDIVDVTPSNVVREEDNIIKGILAWGIENNIFIYSLIGFIANELRKKYGKKIVINLRVLKLNDLLNNPKIFMSYAKINDILCGGINIPRKVSKEVLIENIASDFAGFSKEELQKLKEKLNQETDSRIAIRLIDNVPFIKDNVEEIKRILKNKN